MEAVTVSAYVIAGGALGQWIGAFAGRHLGDDQPWTGYRVGSVLGFFVGLTAGAVLGVYAARALTPDCFLF